jgi:two-component system, NarL family, sensor histidine kinase UhpB
MMDLMDLLSRLDTHYRESIHQVSIFNRVLIGNSVIIVLGAIAGTLMTRHLTLFGNGWLILIFASVGVLITLLVNRVIIRGALRPLRELGDALEHVDGGEIDIPDSLKNYQDPDIHRLVSAIDTTLGRLAERTRELQAISERAINAQEEERVRIARSLHDDTAQSISMLIIRLDRLGSMIPADKPEITRHLADARTVATQLLENLRKVIWDLRPSILDDLGLPAAVRWYARANLESVGVKVDFWGATELGRLPVHLETMLFRITQEAVSNILRHASASKVGIRLWREDHHICLEIQDDGRGFDTAATAGSAVLRKQLGLLGIHERVTLVGGEMHVQSGQGTGTILKVRVPLPIEEAIPSGQVEADLTSASEGILQP